MLSVYNHKSVLEDISTTKTFFSKPILEIFIKGPGLLLETFFLMLDDIQVGYGIMEYDEESLCNSLEIFEIFQPYQNLGYGTWFINYLRNIYVFHLQPFNGTLHYYFKLGAKPIISYGKDIIVAFLGDIKPSKYFKKIANPSEIFKYTDDFIYSREDWPSEW